ncbi:MAG TPA: sigma-54-dependent Fis family transcriptional regulator [Thioploca sp.]|nr:MAG: hypothetical protein B6247_29670 [Beggiatoa sp. 4572_84]RKZ58019.1 MAG: sigma-54-dependent Fis family transcriptional regulator [Gammaproteobacteria bacterium]HDN26371.1 sigma-54-dependent Fis family transcriptional regulator [Thioploca sp.]
METKPQPTVLLVEGDVVTATTYKTFLSEEPINLTHVETGTAALTYLQNRVPTIILLDLELPDINGMMILKYLKQQQLGCTVIAITAENAVDVVIEAKLEGAFDYIEKPLQANRLIIALRSAIPQYNSTPFSDFVQKDRLRERYHKFIGASKPMQTVYQMIDNVATSQAPILITGEHGTGKELCADAIHRESRRKDKPFVVLDCAVIPNDLLESHLFRHVKGAFTGAVNGQQGAASRADGGTLFLDEIVEMSPELQSTLLRFVQTGTFDKVGGDKQEQADVRLICTTNQDLPSKISARRFSEELYYRLNAIHIKLPALRIRGKDILLLAHTFLHNISKPEQKTFEGFSTEAEQILLDYNWPGNVRQLRSVILNMVLMNQGGMITADMLRTIINENDPASEYTTTNPSLPTTQEPPLSRFKIAIMSGNAFRPLREIERDMILKAIEFSNGDIKKAAKGLRISLTTLHRKMRQ